MPANRILTPRRGRFLRPILFGILLGFAVIFFWPHVSKQISSHHSLATRDDATVESILPHSHGLSHGHSHGSPSHSSLAHRDSYSCSASNPCSNGACCGASGYCGYGDTYCGTGCLSNCDATAECGKYAATTNKTCPLNTCCSQYGFCGTTKDFCEDGCQSNCVLTPKAPSGASSVSIIDNKVIGYYEGWMARKSCHKIKPVDLPLDALTHVNFAFAYIDPSSYEVVNMDSSTPTSLFKDVTEVKSIQQDISVFVSIGGWSFSDNDTDTQALFGEIAASESKRKTFAHNVLHFMQQYGFDGLDIDWEYPGAGDRGGSSEDTENYVQLLKTLREVFDASGGTFGLTFTAPSSYWYLRWFDLPGMMKYADWINVMTYDLHGVWDASDPIGNIVQGHTNLTEIKTALELFWRVNIPPKNIVLGFGFYGRAFSLEDSSCSTPGCPFSGASDPASCSDTAGMLAYYEIQSILEKDSSITPTHDEEAAVNYFTFDKNQWVSYDDKTTFKQKVDWANDVGLGGAMIWASDLDDDKYSAHTGLIGRTIIDTATLQTEDKAVSNPKSTITDLAAFNGQKCFRYSGKCVNLNDNKAMSYACGSKYTVVGWDDAGCGKSNCHCGKPICCPKDSAPSSCKWRGDNTGDGTGQASDCSGQCAKGEININGIKSSWGGGFTNDGNTDKCGRGYKVLCCADPDYAEVTEGCSWTACGKDCTGGDQAVLTKYDNCWSKGQKYCCPQPVELVGCNWKSGGSGDDCANARCNSTELQITTSLYGNHGDACDWGRTRAGCCTVKKSPTRKAMCTMSLCDIIGGYCTSLLDNDSETDDSTNDAIYSKRGLGALSVSEIPDTSSDDFGLDKRERKSFKVGSLTIYYIIAAYPAVGRLFTIKYASFLLRKAFWSRKGYCAGSILTSTELDKEGQPPKSQYEGADTEHVFDKELQKLFLRTLATGTYSGSGKVAPFQPLGTDFWKEKWDKAYPALAKKGAVGSNPKGKSPAKPMERVSEAWGSTFNPEPFMVLQNDINVAKGNIFRNQAPVSDLRIKRLFEKALKDGTEQSANKLLSAFQQVFAAFEYIRLNEFQTRFDMVNSAMYTELSNIEEVTETYNLQNAWGLWMNDQFGTNLDTARREARERIRETRDAYIQAALNHQAPDNYDRVMEALQGFEDLIADIKMPRINSFKKANPYNGEGPSGGNGEL